MGREEFKMARGATWTVGPSVMVTYKDGQRIERLMSDLSEEELQEWRVRANKRAVEAAGLTVIKVLTPDEAEEFYRQQE